jgi:hypothetical protein
LDDVRTAIARTDGNSVAGVYHGGHAHCQPPRIRRFIARPPFCHGGAARIDPTLPPLAPKALRAMGATMALSLIAKSNR